MSNERLGCPGAEKVPKIFGLVVSSWIKVKVTVPVRLMPGLARSTNVKAAVTPVRVKLPWMSSTAVGNGFGLLGPRVYVPVFPSKVAAPLIALNVTLSEPGPGGVETFFASNVMPAVLLGPKPRVSA
jgi:hypothetical protein